MGTGGGGTGGEWRKEGREGGGRRGEGLNDRKGVGGDE